MAGTGSRSSSISGDREWIEAPLDRRMKNEDPNAEAFNISLDNSRK